MLRAQGNASIKCQGQQVRLKSCAQHNHDIGCDRACKQCLLLHPRALSGWCMPATASLCPAAHCSVLCCMRIVSTPAAELSWRIVGSVPSEQLAGASVGVLLHSWPQQP